MIISEILFWTFTSHVYWGIWKTRRKISEYRFSWRGATKNTLRFIFYSQLLSFDSQIWWMPSLECIDFETMNKHFMTIHRWAVNNIESELCPWPLWRSKKIRPSDRFPNTTIYIPNAFAWISPPSLIRTGTCIHILDNSLDYNICRTPHLFVVPYIFFRYKH